MASPSAAILRLDYSMSYAEFDLALNRKGYVGMKVMPSVPVEHQEAQFRRINAASIKRPTQDSTRAENTKYGVVDFQWSSDSYATVEHGLEHPIDDRNRKRWGDMINQETVSAMVIEDVLMTEYEVAVANYVQTQANVGSYCAAGKTGSNGSQSGTAYAWTDHANAVPEQDLLNMISALEDATGQTPNTIVIPSKRIRDLRQCSSIISQIKYSGLANPTLPTAAIISILQEMTECPNILIAKGFTNTAGEGGATPTWTRIWDVTKIFVGVCNDGGGSLMSPVLRFGNTLQWSEEAASNEADGQLGLFFEQYRSEETRGEVMRGRTDYVLKGMQSALGGLITGA